MAWAGKGLEPGEESSSILSPHPHPCKATRLFCVFFALLGIPFNLAVLNHLGHLMKHAVHRCAHRLEDSWQIRGVVRNWDESSPERETVVEMGCRSRRDEMGKMRGLVELGEHSPK